jgi:hypothetical protein
MPPRKREHERRRASGGIKNGPTLLAAAKLKNRHYKNGEAWI